MKGRIAERDRERERERGGGQKETWMVKNAGWNPTPKLGGKFCLNNHTNVVNLFCTKPKTLKQKASLPASWIWACHDQTL